jgi:hypothetical protein
MTRDSREGKSRSHVPLDTGSSDRFGEATIEMTRGGDEYCERHLEGCSPK